MKLSIFLVATTISAFGAAFEGQIQRLLYYADGVLARTPLKELQPVLDSTTTIIVPMLDNKVFFKEYDDGEVVEPLYLSGRSENGLKLEDDNRYLYLGEDMYGTKYTAVEFKDMPAFEKFHGPADERMEDGGKLTQRSLREVSEKIPDYEAVSICSQAVGLNTWHTKTRYCTKCGGPLKSERGGAVLRCQNQECRASNYPRIEPATMNFITDESNQYALLGRKANWPEGRYSCLAGFLEVGETLEQCVLRETLEESGVSVDEHSVVYVGSQPWPFPSSLMIGYRGVALRAEGQASDELPFIAFDEKEMQDVRWFSVADVREGLLATRGSTALGEDKEGFTQQEQAIEGTLHFPGPSSMARVMLTEWVLEQQGRA